MKVILRDNVRKVGHKYDIVEVSDGYALNHLIPKRLADRASASALQHIESVRVKAQTSLEEGEKSLSDLILRASEQTVTLSENANDQGHLFAKLDVQEIASSLSTLLGSDFPVSAIILKNPIKQIGEYDVELISQSFKKPLKVIVEKK